MSSQVANLPSSAEAVAGVRFSTDVFPQGDRVEAWRALFGHTICQTDIEPILGSAFRSDVVLRAMPNLGMASGFCSGARYWRAAPLIVDDDLIFVVNHAGTDLADMIGRQSEVKAGEAVLVTTGAVGGVINASATRFTTMRMPRAVLENALPDVHAAMVKPISADNPMLRLLLNYISVLEDTRAMKTDEQRRAVVSNVHDLIALALGATPEAAAVAKYRGAAAARLRAIKAYIRATIADQDADPNVIAARHNITPRYLQMLFEREHTTFSDFVLSERLAAAHRMLRDRQLARQSISDIAFSVGFHDISYFNRTFRRTFGATPSDVRHRPPLGGEKR
jgi:AraC-like DNA-binding protein